MNETIHPDPPSKEEIQRLNNACEYLKEGVKNMKASFENKHPTQNDDDQQQVFDKNIMDNIELMSKTITRLAKNIDKLTTYSHYLITDPEIDAHVNHFMTPHLERIMHVENLVTLTNQNMKHRDENILILLDESDETNKRLEDIDKELPDIKQHTHTHTLYNMRYCHR